MPKPAINLELKNDSLSHYVDKVIKDRIPEKKRKEPRKIEVVVIMDDVLKLKTIEEKLDWFLQNFIQ